MAIAAGAATFRKTRRLKRDAVVMGPVLWGCSFHARAQSLLPASKNILSMRPLLAHPPYGGQRVAGDQRSTAYQSSELRSRAHGVERAGLWDKAQSAPGQR